MKSKEELTQLRTEYEALNNKLKELSDEELKEVCAGVTVWDIAVKLKEKFNISTGLSTHGKTGKPTLPLWDEASPGLIDDSENPIGKIFNNYSGE